MKHRNLRLILGLITLVFVAWLIVVCAYAGGGQERLRFWLSVGFTALTFVLSAVSLYYAGLVPGAGMTEVNALPIWSTLVYFLLIIVINTVFVCLEPGSGLLHIVLNLLFLVIFAACRVFIPNYVTHAAYASKVVKLKTGSTAHISKQIGILMQYAEDSEIRTALRELQEYIAYSDNVGSAAASEIENAIMGRLPELRDMMEQKQEPQLILNRISEIKTLWKERSAYMG